MAIIEFGASPQEPDLCSLQYNATYAAQTKVAYATNGSGWLGIQESHAFGATRLSSSVFADAGPFYTTLAADSPHVAWDYSNQPLPDDNPLGTLNISTSSTSSTSL